MTAAQPAPIPLAHVDPALREEFDLLMQGFIVPANGSADTVKALRDHYNAVNGARAQKVRSLAEIPALWSESPVVSPSQVVTSVNVASYSPAQDVKPLPRRMAVSPKPSVEPAGTSRTAQRLRLYRQMLCALFLSTNEALEECPELLPHMVPVVVR